MVQDGCGLAFSIFHTLDRKKGGFITARHNELRDGVADLAEKAFTPAHVRNNPKLFTSGAVQGGGQRQRKRERHRGTAGE